MNLIELKTFLTVIEENGITAAAHRLNLTQPAVSKRLENLKQSFGIKDLFNRDSGSLKVSKDAEILIPYAKNIVAPITQRYLNIFPKTPLEFKNIIAKVIEK